MQITLSLLVFHIQIALNSHSFASINIHTSVLPERCVWVRDTMSRSWLLVGDLERGAWARTPLSMGRSNLDHGQCETKRVYIVHIQVTLSLVFHIQTALNLYSLASHQYTHLR